MKKLKNQLFVLFAACLCFAGFAVAEDKDPKDKEDETTLVCSIYPPYCGVTTNGNGGGVRPPQPE